MGGFPGPHSQTWNPGLWFPLPEGGPCLSHTLSGQERDPWLLPPAQPALPRPARPASPTPDSRLSSCRLREGANREVLGIIVSYKVKVKLVVSRGG